MRKVTGIDADPLNDKCDACGAEVAEDCRPGCVGQVQHDEIVLGRTTGGSPRLVVLPLD